MRILLLLLCAGAVSAQSMVVVGDGQSVGCQIPGSTHLTSGVPGTGLVDFDYDPATATVTLTVTNSSPIIAGWNHPVITGVFFNVPAIVTGLSLVSQAPVGGAHAVPFQLQMPADAGCLGSFGAALATGTVHGGITNPAAPLVVGPSGSMVDGPVTFMLLVSASNPGALTTSDFVQAASTNGYAAGLKFQGGGPGGGPASGFVGSLPCVNMAEALSLGSGCSLPLDPVLTIDPPVLGEPTTITIQSAFPDAFGWIFVSLPPVTPYAVPETTCTVYVDILNPANFLRAISFVTDSNGNWTTTFPVPAAAWLPGFSIIVQARLCSPTGPPGPLAPDWISNGLLLTVGCE